MNRRDRISFLEQSTNKFPKLPPRAAQVAFWIETYCHFTESGCTKKFVLLPFQLEILEGVYPGNPGDKRIITRALISMARKNGKTELCSALVLVHLAGPEAARGSQIICAAAANQDQAGLVFTGSSEMAKAHPKLTKSFTFRENRLIYDLHGVNNYAKTISTKPSSAQGLRPAFWVYDEIAETESRGLYEALNLAQTNQVFGGLGVIISTRSTKPLSMFRILDEEISVGQSIGINKNWYRRIWSADPKAKNPFTMDQVRAANPAIGYILDEEAIQRDLDNAIHSESARPEFRARRLNIESGSNAALVDATTWGDAGIALKPREELYEDMAKEDVVLGMDLGSTTSMTSLALYWPNKRFVSVINWMAKDQVQHNSTIHKVPYQEYADDGRLLLVEGIPGVGMDYGAIADHIVMCFKRFNVISFRYDGWNKWRMWEKLSDRGLHYEQYPMKGVLDKFIQGAQSYGEAIIEFEDMMLNNALKHDNDPVTNMSIFVCQVDTDASATKAMRKPVKNTQQLPNDAAVAMLMSISNRGLYAKAGGLTDEEFDAFYSGGHTAGLAVSEDEKDDDIFNEFYGKGM